MSNLKQSFIKYCKLWFIGIDEEAENKSATVLVWFPATKNHRYD